MSERVLRPAAINISDQIEKRIADCRLARTRFCARSFTRMKSRRGVVAGDVDSLGFPSRFDALLNYAFARVASAHFLLVKLLARLGAGRPRTIRHADVSGGFASANCQVLIGCPRNPATTQPIQ